jgi:hypothetical protein
MASQSEALHAGTNMRHGKPTDLIWIISASLDKLYDVCGK